MLNGSAIAEDIALSPRSQQRAATKAVAQATYEADKEYDKNTLAAPVVLYDTGRDGTAQLPPIRALNPDKATGEWRLLTKQGKTLMDFRGHIVGVHARGWGAEMWSLTTEQGANFDRFEWLLAQGSYERVLRGCAANCGGGLATLRTQQVRVLAVTHLLEMLHMQDALALKARLVAYWRFLDEFRIANQPYAVEEPAVEKPASTKRTASDVLADMTVSRLVTGEDQAAKRSRGSPRENNVMGKQPGSPVPSNASSVSSADTVEGGDVAAVQHTPGLSDVEAQHYVKAVLAHIAEARNVSMPAVFEMLTEARESAEANPAEFLGEFVSEEEFENHGHGDHPAAAAYDEALRVATRAMLVKEHSFRMAFAQLNDGIRAAMDHGCEVGQTEGFEGLRNDIGHTTFDKGDYRIVFGADGACDWQLATTNKRARQTTRKTFARPARISPTSWLPTARSPTPCVPRDTTRHRFCAARRDRNKTRSAGCSLSRTARGRTKQGSATTPYRSAAKVSARNTIRPTPNHRSRRNANRATCYVACATVHRLSVRWRTVPAIRATETTVQEARNRGQRRRRRRWGVCKRAVATCV